MTESITRREFIKIGAAGLGAAAIESFAGSAFRLPQPPVSRIAFGSCLFDSAQAQVLDVVVQKSAPHAFVWLGDTIYANTTDMAVLKAKYDVLSSNPRFQRLRDFCPQLATWDNHDFGYGRVGAEHPKKRESQKEFLDFWKIPSTDPRRQRDGIYHSHVFGTFPQAIQVILLDCRFFKTQTEAEAGGTILGAAQWAWLEDQFTVPASLRIICSSIQVLSNEHGWDGWSVFPKERAKLYNLIKNTKTQGVVFTSGDQHWAELTRSMGDMGYPAYDLTASALDQTEPMPANSKRVGPGYNTANFGVIEVDWGLQDPFVNFKIRSATDASVKIDHTIPLSVLHPWTPTGIAGSGRKPPAGHAIPSKSLKEYSVTGRRLGRK